MQPKKPRGELRAYGLDMVRKPNVRMSVPQEDVNKSAAESIGVSLGAYLRNAGLILGGREDLCDLPPELIKAMKRKARR